MQNITKIIVIMSCLIVHVHADERKQGSPRQIISIPGIPSIPVPTPDIPSIPIPDVPLIPIPDRPTNGGDSNRESAITSKTGGIWFNPNNDGEGFFFHIDDTLLFTVTWYSFDDQGQQMWLIGTESYASGDNSITIQLQRPQGTRFGHQFNGTEVSKPIWGTLTLTFDTCNNGVAVFESNDDRTFGSGTIPIIKLSSNAQSFCSLAPIPVNSPSYSKDEIDPVQGFGVGEFTSAGDHDISGVMIVSERLLIKNGQCYLEVTLTNHTDNAKVNAVLSYDFFSRSENIASSGATALFTQTGQTIISENPVSVFNARFSNETDCDLYDEISVGGFLVPVR
ncbi:MAG: hypothetical protein V3V22_06700 [Methylococcales bacterium]